MKMTYVEFARYVAACESELSTAQLQDVHLSGNILTLEFYRHGGLWLLCDLDPAHPELVLLKKSPPLKGKTVKPVVLFLRSHGRGLRVESLKGVTELGRVARLRLSTLIPGQDRHCTVDLQMVPHAANLLVVSDEKRIAFRPPRELKLIEKEESDSQSETSSDGPFSVESVEKRWWESRTKSADSPPEKKDSSRALAKKTKALETLRGELLKIEEGAVQAELVDYANARASHQTIPDSLKAYEGLSIEDAHLRVKKLNQKAQGVRDRIKKVSEEIVALEKAGPDRERPSFGVRQMQVVGATGRHLDLGSSVSAIIGKSAKDNLDLLRKARAWDLWVHIKDYPGAHGLIFRNKDQNVSSEQIEMVFQRLLRESKNTRSLPPGVKLELLVTECRFVRPIKGDRLGRVQFQNARVFLFASKSP